MVSIHGHTASLTGAYLEELSERLKLVLLFDDPANPTIIKQGLDGAIIQLPNVNQLKLQGLMNSDERGFKIASQTITAGGSQFELVFGREFEITAFPSAQYNRELGTMYVIYLDPAKTLDSMVPVDSMTDKSRLTDLADTVAPELSERGKQLLDRKHPLPASRKEARELLVKRIDDGVGLVSGTANIDPRRVRHHLNSLKRILQKLVQNAPLTVRERVTLGTPLTESFEDQINESITMLASELNYVDDKLAIQTIQPDQNSQIFSVRGMPKPTQGRPKTSVVDSEEESATVVFDPVEQLMALYIELFDQMIR